MSDKIDISKIRCDGGDSTIIGKIANKSKINKFRNGQGELFSMQICDESANIRMVFFNEMASKHFDSITFGKWYSVSFFRVAKARQGTNPYEIHCTDKTTFTEIEMEESVEYSSIKDTLGMNTYDVINIIGVCKTVSETSVIQKKDGSGPLLKKVIDIMDINNDLIGIQVFDSNIDSFLAIEKGVIAAFNSLSLNEYNSKRYLTFNNNSSIQLNPEHESVEQIKTMMNSQDIENVETMNSHGFLKLEDAVQMFNGETFEFSASVKICDIDLSWVYMTCPTDICYQKVKLMEDGNYRCDGCNKSFQTCTTQALIQMLTEGNHWLTSFSATSLKLLEMDSTEFGYLVKYQPNVLKSRCAKLYEKVLNLRLKAKSQGSNDNPQFVIENVIAPPQTDEANAPHVDQTNNGNDNDETETKADENKLRRKRGAAAVSKHLTLNNNNEAENDAIEANAEKKKLRRK